MTAALVVLAVLAIAGWFSAWRLYCQRRDHRCPIEQPTKAVLVNAAGLPESIRSLRGVPPKTYTRAHGRGVSTEYKRVGTAAIYQAP